MSQCCICCIMLNGDLNCCTQWLFDWAVDFMWLMFYFAHFWPYLLYPVTLCDSAVDSMAWWWAFVFNNYVVLCSMVISPVAFCCMVLWWAKGGGETFFLLPCEMEIITTSQMGGILNELKGEGSPFDFKIFRVCFWGFLAHHGTQWAQK